MKLSIIIPAYNCEDTLEAAVLSAEAFVDAEIIIVNDGSADSTQQITDSLKTKNPKIRSVMQKNQGPAKARNTGIEIAAGEYLMFLDSDDTFKDNAADIVPIGLEDSPDVLIFGFVQRFSNMAPDKEYSLSSPFSVDEYYKSNLLNQVWNKAYKREFILNNNIRFKDYRYGEDRIFNAQVLSFSPKVKAIGDILYNYNIDRSLSLISGYIPEKFDSCKEINRYYSDLCSDKTVADYMFLKNLVSCMTVLFAENCKLNTKQKKAEIKKLLNDNAVKDNLNAKLCGADEIIRRIIKTRLTNLNFLVAFLISFIQKNMLPLFLKFRK